MLFDYSREPHSDIAFVDMKSFYASCECVRLGLNPLTTSLCVMSRSDNSAGLILASSPVFKQVFATSQKNKDCQRIQALLHPLNPGPRGP